MAAGGGDGEVPSVFKWTDEDTERLITWRIANESLFTGKRNAAIKGFEAFIHEKNLKGKVSATWVKKKWENLKQKYKAGTWMSGADTAAARRFLTTSPHTTSLASMLCSLTSPSSSSSTSASIMSPAARHMLCRITQHVMTIGVNSGLTSRALKKMDLQRVLSIPKALSITHLALE
ncbi:uncharacterized protein [Garra rufa]|uniref:uncharacterized protein isoform X2 n=1 Tax=Garra rufa TaxID=137080 RepID=UPI003CCEABE0